MKSSVKFSNTAALRALLAAATPEPWAVTEDGVIQHPTVTDEGQPANQLIADVWGHDESDEWEPDAALIAAAVNALPALLDEVEALRAALDFIADWAHDYGFVDIEEKARAALAEATPDGGVE